MLTAYSSLLRDRRVATPFLFSILARFPIAMAPLGTVVLVEEIRGSYATAGLVTGAFALANAVSSPAWSALMDRVGQPRVIAGTSVAFALLLAATTLLATSGASDAVLLASAALTGLTFAPINPAMRVAWSVVVPPERLRSAYAMDAAAVETIFVMGPLLLTALLLGPAALPLLVTAALMAIGGLGYARSFAARTWEPVKVTETEARGRSPLRSPGMLLTLATGLGTAIAFGHTDVAMTATAERTFGSTAVLGVFFAFIATGSAVGGLWYGGHQLRGPDRRRLPVALLGFGTGSALLALLLAGAGRPPLYLLLPLLLVTGLCIAPSLIIQQALVDESSAPSRRSEAQGWLMTGLTAGGALGMSIAGFLVEAAGPAAAFAGAATALGVAFLVALAAQPLWRRTPNPG